jgi:hypothetical protein
MSQPATGPGSVSTRRSSRACALLAAWGSAWLHGDVGFDDVLDAVAEKGIPFASGPGFEPGTLHPVSAVLADLRRRGAPYLRLALPVPGDVRGLAGSVAFRATALEAGQAVFGADVALTCRLAPATPSSAARALIWWRDTIGPRSQPDRPDPISVAEAERDLAEAIRETATEFARRGSSSWLTDVAPALSNARRAGEPLNLPATHPSRAVRMIAQAERLSAVLHVVDADTTGELTAAAAAGKAAALGPLRTAVRRALLAGYNAAAEVSAG